MIPAPQSVAVRPPPRPAGLCVRRLGRRRYGVARALQEEAARRVEEGGDDEILLVEHPPVVTVGRGGGAEQLRLPARELARRGVVVVETDRGGGATYHGPGQLVGYPVVALRRRRMTIRGYVRGLEGALLDVLAGEGVDAYRRPGLTGVWTDDGKVAAIGIGVRRGVTRHGFALNVDTDLEAFGWIVPCGLGEPVTSLRRQGWTGRRATLERRLVERLGHLLDDAALDGR